jgi:LacI family transcriptional regulator
MELGDAFHNPEKRTSFCSFRLPLNRKEYIELNGNTTIIEIARLAGVSRSTVSRVLNDDPNVNSRTRAKVQAVIDELGYQPSPVARSLIGGRSHVLGLVLPTFYSRLVTDPFFSILAHGISSGCNANDYTLMLWLVDPDYEKRTRNNILNNRLIDGIIVASNVIDDPLIQRLVDQKTPVVQVGRNSNPNISSVDADNVAGARLAAEHLLNLGRKRLATITGPIDRFSGQDRLAGFRQGLAEKNLDLPEVRIAYGDFTEEGGYLQAKALLSRTQFDGLFAASDVTAFGAIRAIRETGLKVPENVAVIGFDDLPSCLRHTPPLTSIHQPIHQMGVVAAQTLIDQLESKEAFSPQRVILPVELIERASTNLPG